MAPIPAGYVSIARQRSMELKKQHPRQQQQQPSSIKCITGNNATLGRRTGDDDDNACKTPKSKEYRLPEEAPVCPPTPMKPRCGRRIFPPPNGYFSSPELDGFFNNQLDFSSVA